MKQTDKEKRKYNALTKKEIENQPELAISVRTSVKNKVLLLQFSLLNLLTKEGIKRNQDIGKYFEP